MPILERLRCDLTAIVKGLRASRTLLAFAVLTLAFGIGVNGAMLGLVDRALLGLPRYLHNPEELFIVAFERAGEGAAMRMTSTSYPTFRAIRDETAAVKGAAAWQTGPSAVIIDNEQVDARTLLVSSRFFEVLGALPQLGRAAFDHGVAAVVISHDFWTSTLRGDPHVLGRRIRLRGSAFEVTAVMPRGFSGHSAEAVDAWFPIEEAMRGTPGWDNPFRNAVSIVVRVAPTDLEAAATQASAVTGGTVVLSSLAGAGIGEQERRIAVWLVGLSVLVLVIGLANAGTLLLVRAAKRRREMALRAALGAGRGLLLRQLAGESLCVALASAAASLLLSRWFDEAVRRVLLPGVVEGDGFDPLTLAVAAGAGAIAGVIALAVGAAHMPSSTRPDQLKEAPARRALQRTLLFVQAALSVLLLGGAGMFGRSLHGLMNQDFGFTTDGVLLVDFEQGGGLQVETDPLFEAALSKVRKLPGVELATFYQSMPFGNFHVPPIAVPGLAEAPSVGQQLPYLIAATPEFLRILGIRIVEGRRFTPADERGAPVVIVNETMAKTIWPGETAIGKCIRIGFDPDFDPSTATEPPTPSSAVPCRQIVGVARDVRQRSVVPDGNEARLMQYYVPFSQIPPPPAAVGHGPGIAGLLVKAHASRGVSPDALARMVANGRADLPPVRVRTYASLLERQVRPWQLGVTLLTLFSTLAVLLAAIGLYASFAHAVVLRKREMAIRIAIGASPAAVRLLIFRDAVFLTLVAAAAGSVGALLAGRSLQSLLYGLVAADPLVLGGAAALMIGIAIASTCAPAFSAAASDPNALLRAE
jgi:putative ABC transport system permease protein